MTSIKPHPMHNDEVRARCHDRDLRSKVYVGFRTHLAYIRDSRNEGKAWSDIVTGLLERGVAGATIHRLLAWVRTPRFGAWELDEGEPAWTVKIGVGKGLRSFNDHVQKAASFTSSPQSRVIAPTLPPPPERYTGDDPDLPAESSRMKDDELRQEYAELSQMIKDTINGVISYLDFERRIKAQFAKEIVQRGLTDIQLDPEDIPR